MQQNTVLTKDQLIAIEKLRGCVHAAQEFVSKTFNAHHLDILFLISLNEGVIAQACIINKPTDFWHLKLPRETKAYVPKLLAEDLRFLQHLYSDQVERRE